MTLQPDCLEPRNPRPRASLAVLASTLAVAVLLTAFPASAQVDFLFSRPVDVGGGPETVVAADLDLDGVLDLASADGRNGSVSFVKGRGSHFDVGQPIDVGELPSGLDACDLDNDGRPDLANGHFSFDLPVITVLLNRSPAGGPVSFERTTVDVGARSSAIVCADLDDDGDRDLAVTLYDDEAALTFFNDGQGGFVAGNMLTVERGPVSIDAGDLDGDGLPDLVVANDQSASVSVLLNDPQAPGQFLEQQVVAVGSAPDEVVLADLDADGDLDAATANRGEATTTVLLNDGAGGLGRRAEYPVAGLSLAIAAGDFDCDGLNDLAVASDTSDQVAILLGDPADPGSFQPFVPFNVSDDTRSLAPGDFDGNGHLDLGTAHFRPDRVSALINRADGTFSSFHHGGEADDFAPGNEPASRADDLDAFLAGVSARPPLDFDEAGTDRWFGHSFEDLPRCVVSAELEIQVEAVSGGADNDSVCFEVLDATPGAPRYGWCSRFERLPESGGAWRTGDRAVFTLDLDALPPDGRGTTGVLDLLTDGRLDLLVQDDTRVDHARLSVRTCCRCEDAAPLVREGGVEDGYEPPPEAVSPRPELDALIRANTGSPSLRFDEAVTDRWFGHTFTDLPPCIEAAHLEIGLRALSGGSTTDALYLQVIEPMGARTAWGIHLNDLAGGDWVLGREERFELDLANLPPSPAGVTNVLEALDTGYLDVLIQDDTAVDFARLVVTPCCPPPQPPSTVYGVHPALPGYGIQVLFTASEGLQLAGTIEPDCIGETVCVSGALPGRSEVFARVVGPKPNGKLWPTLVKFSTSQVEVWVKQLATDEVRYYVLPGARPGFDELPGLFDRDGFDPVGGGGALWHPPLDPLDLLDLLDPVAAVARRNEEAPPPPDEAPLVSPDVPDFRFWVRITSPQGGESPTRLDAECIEETVCVSGALPGRSEVFLRVVGPKPNGRLWPTLVRFTTSTVEVWIEQESTGALRYYRLEGASPGSEDLTGLFDRQGFLP